MDGFMGYDPQTVMLAILLLVIVGMIIYRSYSTPLSEQNEKGVVKAEDGPNEEEEQ
jgi:hypothetical protein